jgi:hypothetical protein
MVLARSTSEASELGSIDSCTCTRIPLETHSFLPARDSPSAAKVDSSLWVGGCCCCGSCPFLWVRGAEVAATAMSSLWVYIASSNVAST